MRCSKMKPETLYNRCVGKFAEDEKFFIIPAGLPGAKDGRITTETYKRLVVDTYYGLHMEANDDRVPDSIKYDSIYSIGETFDIDEEDSFGRCVIRGFSKLLSLFLYKTTIKTTFGIPIQIVCFDHEWIIEGHGDTIALINLSPPMKYKTSFIKIDDIKKDNNLLKEFIREIISTSINYYYKTKTWYVIDSFLNDNWIEYFCETIEQRDNINITNEDCYEMIKNEAIKLYDVLLEYDFNKFDNEDSFYDEFKENNIITNEAPHLMDY